jgi:electron transfer flavoprotein beta subunit
MKCLVAIKRVVDPFVHIRVKSDSTGVETSNVKMAMNPFDEIAMEEAVRLKEQGIISEIIAISIGAKTSQEILRQALARGADRAKLLETDLDLSCLDIAKLLTVYVKQENPDLVLMGKQAIDNDCNQTGQMLAGLLGWAQGTFASKVVVDKQQKTLEVTREVDGGLEVLKLILPAVVTTDLRLNEPRYISLPNVMQAKRKPLDIIKIEELGVTIKTSIKKIRVGMPEKRKAGQMLQNVEELIEKLTADKVL